MSKRAEPHSQAALAQKTYATVHQSAEGADIGGHGGSILGGERLMRRPEVEARTGLSRSTIYDWMRRGKFPQPVKLGERLVAWKESDLTAWIESRAS